MKTEKLRVGGQSVVNGVMMRSENLYSIALRNQSKEIDVELFPVKSIIKKYPMAKLPLIRGVITYIENLILGFKALMYSVDKTGAKEVEISWLQMTISIILAVALTFGLFFALPTFLGKFIYQSIPNIFLYNLIEGLIRLTILICYIIFTSFLKDIKTLYEYHGAEHKVIHAYEAGEELTASKVNKYSTLHMRCGTAFLMIVVVISIIIFSLLGRQSLIQRIIYRIILVPLIMGISYEFIRLAGKFPESLILKIVSFPGLLLQRLTTRIPSKEQLEVAIIALNKVTEKEEVLNKGKLLNKDRDFSILP
ncbi:MAG: DUF1385 domain-containing protein [Candidatus Humimicrobiia bacterium]